MLLMAITFLGDFLWLIYWTPAWWGSELSKSQFWLHSFVIITSFANWLLKLIILGTIAAINGDELKNRLK